MTLLRLDPSLVTGTKGEEVPRLEKKRKLSSTKLAIIPAKKASRPSYRLGETEYSFGSNLIQQAQNQADFTKLRAKRRMRTVALCDC